MMKVKIKLKIENTGLKMRGSTFYDNGRLGQRDLDRNYVHHRQMLDQIRSRHKSQMRKYTYLQ